MTATFTNPTDRRAAAPTSLLNGKGQYQIPDPVTGQPAVWTRATTFIAAIKDTYALDRWSLRTATRGLVARADLYAKAANVIDDDRALDHVVDEAKEAAAASAGATLGTALHDWAEQVDAGATPHIPEPWASDIAAYRRRLAAEGVQIAAGMLERVVVVPKHHVAGTMDRLAYVPQTARPHLPVVADLKTGQSAHPNAFGDWALQLALYGTGEWLFNPDDRTFQRMPEIQTDVGLIIHLPAGQADCTLYLIDLTEAHAMLDVCGQVRHWRRASRELARPIAATASPAMPPVAHVGPTHDAGPLEIAMFTRRLDYMRNRAQHLIGHAGADPLYQALAALPEKLVTFAEHANPDEAGTLDANALDVWDTLLTNVEARTETPFYSDLDPVTQAVAPDGMIGDVRARWERLPVDLRPDWTSTPTVRQLDDVDQNVTVAETHAARRVDRVILAAAALYGAGAEPGCPAFDLIRQTVTVDNDGVIDPTSVTGPGADVLDALADAVTGTPPVLTIVDGTFVCHPDPLIDRFDGKRGVTTAAKTIYENYERLLGHRPRRADEILNDPAAVALLNTLDTTVEGPTNQPKEGT
ncbi:MAG: hypothetical protein ACF8PN_08055 [Phycisphaerales bacterium]